MDINYDEVFCGDSWAITLKGKKYKAEIPTIAQSIAFEKSVAAIAGLSGVDLIEQLKKVILVIFKDLPEEDIDNCKAPLLKRMLDDVKTMVQQGLYPEDTDKQGKKK